METDSPTRRVATVTRHLTAAAAATTATIPPDSRPLPNPAPDADDAVARGAVNAHLIGNFAPTSEEGHFEDVEVTWGAVPADMAPGQFLRVGPNPRYSFAGLPYHVFDGDGFVHCVSFKSAADGARRCTYTKRWVRTRRLVTAERRGFDVAELGEQAYGRLGYMGAVVDGDPDSPQPGHRMGKANTAMVAHAGRVLVLEEADKPYHIVASWDGESNLRTVGRFDFNGKLAHDVTAHPKVDPVTKELVMFCYSPLCVSRRRARSPRN